MEWDELWKEIADWTESQILQAQCSTPFFDNVGLIKHNVDNCVSELFLSPQLLKAAIVQEQFGADNDELIMTFCNILKPQSMTPAT